MDEGANFKLKISKVDGYWNYDKSEFDNPSALFDNDGKIEEVFNLHIHLQSFLHRLTSSLMKNSRQDLMSVLSGSVTGNVAEQMEDETIATPQVDTTPVQSSSEQEDDDTMDYLRN